MRLRKVEASFGPGHVAEERQGKSANGAEAVRWGVAGDSNRGGFEDVDLGLESAGGLQVGVSGLESVQLLGDALHASVLEEQGQSLGVPLRQGRDVVSVHI